MIFRTDTAGVVPPPLIVLGVILIGLALDRLAPIGVAGAVFPRSVRAAIGGTLVVAAAWPMARALWRFRLAGTPSEPWKPTTALATRGIYRRTRNPMYQAFALFALGFAFAFASDWMFLAFPLAVLIVHFAVVRREERYLSAKFGEDYRAYCARVPRYGWPI
ncbi:MAG: isoprenylcysteine carboxylmethyltransferase family protein [Alphaproteobacteria bacterium]|nr:isoprenylcysteine carboxylmethyltransferase family protein [Alphaproteobacteria bacterium]